MRTTEDAARAIEKLNGLVLHGRAIRVDYSATQKPHLPTPGEYMGAKRPGCEWSGGPPLQTLTLRKQQTKIATSHVGKTEDELTGMTIDDSTIGTVTVTGGNYYPLLSSFA